MSVYFIGNGRGHVKIGKARNPHSRMKDLQTGSPLKLEMLVFIPGGASKEAELHSKFKKHCVRSEWFALEPEINAYIAACRELYKSYMSGGDHTGEKRVWDDAWEEYHAKTSAIDARYDAEVERIEATREAELDAAEAEFDAITEGIFPWWREEDDADS